MLIKTSTISADMNNHHHQQGAKMHFTQHLSAAKDMRKRLEIMNDTLSEEEEREVRKWIKSMHARLRDGRGEKSMRADILDKTNKLAAALKTGKRSAVFNLLRTCGVSESR